MIGRSEQAQCMSNMARESMAFTVSLDRRVCYDVERDSEVGGLAAVRQTYRTLVIEFVCC